MSGNLSVRPAGVFKRAHDQILCLQLLFVQDGAGDGDGIVMQELVAINILKCETDVL